MKHRILKILTRRVYRIVRDNYLGYEVQSRIWYWPIWLAITRPGTYRTINECVDIIKSRRPDFVLLSIIKLGYGRALMQGTVEEIVVQNYLFSDGYYIQERKKFISRYGAASTPILESMYDRLYGESK